MYKKTRVVPQERVERFSDDGSESESELKKNNLKLKEENKAERLKVKTFWLKSLPLEELALRCNVDPRTSEWLEYIVHPKTCLRFAEPGINEAEKENVMSKILYFNSQDVKKIIQTLAEKKREIFTWGFSILDLEEQLLKSNVEEIFGVFNFPQHLKISQTSLTAAIVKIMELHTQKVTESLQRMRQAVTTLHAAALCLIHIQENSIVRLHYIDVLAILLSCIIYTLKNAYKSPGEETNADCSNLFFETIGQDESEANIFSLLPSSTKEQLHQQITTCVLCMEPNHRAKLDIIILLERLIERKRLEKIDVASNPGGVHEQDQKAYINNAVDRQTVMKAICCASSVSYVCKPFEEANKWSQVQFDNPKGIRRENSAKIPSSELRPPSPQGSFNIQLMNINLIDFIAAPFWVAMNHFFSEFDEPFGYMITNRHSWNEEIVRVDNISDTEKDFEDLNSHLSLRQKAFEISYLGRNYDIELKADSSWIIGPSKLFLLKLTNAIPVNLPDKLNVDEDTLKELFLRKHERNKKKKQLSDAEDSKRVTKTPKHPEGTSIVKTRKNSESACMSDIINARTFRFRNSNENGGVQNLRHLSSSSFIQKYDSNLDGDEENNRYRRLKALFDKKWMQVLLLVWTLIALYLDDIRLVFLSTTVDGAVELMFVICLFCFATELFCMCLYKKAYINTFLFWLDIIAILSLILDISFIWNWFLTMFGEEEMTSTAHLTLTRAGRASKAGAKAARLLRIMRYVRLLRVLKIYEFIHRYKKNRTDSKRGTVYTKRYMMRKRTSIGQDRKQIQTLEKVKLPESQIGSHLAEVTTKKVIVMVLVMLMATKFIPRIEIDYSPEIRLNIVHTASVKLRQELDQSGSNRTSLLLDFNDLVTDYISSSPDVIQLSFDDSLNLTDFGNGKPLANFRNAEITIVYAECRSCGSPPDSKRFCQCDPYQLISLGIFDIKASSVEDAWRNMLQTTFVMGMLTLATFTFTYDTQRLVISPIENIVKMVQDLAANPLAKLKKKSRTRTKGAIEIELLDNCIRKIGMLLQISFSKNGAEIIVANMKKTGEIDPLVPGNVIESIFGYCHICDIVDVTEVLREDIIVFVNEVALIVHSQGVIHDGNVSSNNGGNFLLVWHSDREKLKNDHNKEVNDAGPEEAQDSNRWRRVADKALISFLKVMLNVSTNPALRSLSKQDNFFGHQMNERIPNYKVKLSFGIHKGWATEGPVGSDRKIDAAYMSPNVAFTHALGRQLSQMYNIPLLMSGDFHGLLSDDAKRCCRKLDVISLPRTSFVDPINLYTCDVVLNDLIDVKLKAIKLKEEDVDYLERDHRISLLGPKPIIDHRKHRKAVEKNSFRTDLFIRAMQWELPTYFLPLCHKATRVYLAGKWKDAKVLYEAIIKLVPEEEHGPAGKIYDFMEAHDFQAPENWKGYRTDIVIDLNCI